MLAGSPLSRIAQLERRAKQRDLVLVLDRARACELRSDLDRGEPGSQAGCQGAALGRDGRVRDDVRERSCRAADRVERTEAEAGVGDDLAAACGCRARLVLADDQNGSRSGNDHGEWRVCERARACLDVRGIPGEPRDRRRIGREEGSGAGLPRDLGGSLVTGLHQKVTVTPPSTVSTCPVTYVFRALREPGDVLGDLLRHRVAPQWQLAVLDVDVGEPLAVELVLPVDDRHARGDESRCDGVHQHPVP